MKEVKFTVRDEWGLHARPAGLLVKLVQGMESECIITLERTGKSASLKRLLAVMSLGVKGGDNVTVLVQGDDEEEAAEQIEKWLCENM
jgi:phosphocarrier protein